MLELSNGGLGAQVFGIPVLPFSSSLTAFTAIPAKPQYPSAQPQDLRTSQIDIVCGAPLLSSSYDIRMDH
jgi:hypothetical protein